MGVEGRGGGGGGGGCVCSLPPAAGPRGGEEVELDAWWLEPRCVACARKAVPLPPSLNKEGGRGAEQLRGWEQFSVTVLSVSVAVVAGAVTAVWVGWVSIRNCWCGAPPMTGGSVLLAGRFFAIALLAVRLRRARLSRALAACLSSAARRFAMSAGSSESFSAALACFVCAALRARAWAARCSDVCAGSANLNSSLVGSGTGADKPAVGGWLLSGVTVAPTIACWTFRRTVCAVASTAFLALWSAVPIFLVTLSMAGGSRKRLLAVGLHGARALGGGGDAARCAARSAWGAAGCCCLDLEGVGGAALWPRSSASARSSGRRGMGRRG